MCIRDRATLYFSSAHDRWVLEAPDVHFEMTDASGDNRPSDAAFFSSDAEWTQLQLGQSMHVRMRVVCFDTSHPTQQPTDQPTERPTDQPSDEPSESPTRGPTQQPSEQPSTHPSRKPTLSPTKVPFSD